MVSFGMMLLCGIASFELATAFANMDRLNRLPRISDLTSPLRQRPNRGRSWFAGIAGMVCLLILAASASAQQYPDIRGTYQMVEVDIFNIIRGGQAILLTNISTPVSVDVLQTNGQFFIVTPGGIATTNSRGGMLSGNSITNVTGLPVLLDAGFIANTNEIIAASGTVKTNEVDINFTSYASGTVTPGFYPFVAQVTSTIQLFGTFHPLQPPTITTQPASQNVTLGQSASFTVVATGATNLSYQWRKDSALLPGATNATFTIPATAETDLGSYMVYVYNTVGSTNSTNAVLSLNLPAKVKTQPASNTKVALGVATALSVVASGTPPLEYQWRLMGTNIPGATNATYKFVALPVDGKSNLVYSVQVINPYGTDISSDANVTIIKDRFPPTVSITSPAVNARLDKVSFGGLATDNSILTGVTYWVTNINNGRVQVSAQKSALLVGTNLTRQYWTNHPDLLPGTNIVAVYSTDIQGNMSKVATRTFFYKSPSLLTLPIQGSGKVTGKSSVSEPWVPTQTVPAVIQLNIGQGYSVQAKPSANWLFSGWTKSLDGIDQTMTNQTLSFIMEPGLVLTANFVTNPFVHLAGAYGGTFSADPIAPDSSGTLRLNVDTKGGFSGQMVLKGTTYPVSGGFNVGGQATKTVSRPASVGGPVTLNLLISSNGSANLVTGTISSAAWTSVLNAHPAAAGLASSQHTVVIPSGLAQTGPAGFGVLLITNKGPNATVTGKLADGTQVTISSTVWDNGILPFYSSLYKGAGVLLGQVSVNDTNFANTATWSNPTAGFTNEQTLLVSQWLTPPAKTPAAPFTTNSPATLQIAGGPLATPLDYSVAVPPNNTIAKLSSSVSTNALAGSIDPKTGAFKVSVVTQGKTSVSGTGAILQDREVGYGIFGSGTNYGAITIGQTNP